MNYKNLVLSVLKNQLSNDEYLRIKLEIKGAATNTDVYNLAKKYAKDFTAIKKASLLIKSEEAVKNPLMSEYETWVKDNGHLTSSASSVLHDFIKEKNYTEKEYSQLAKEMGFSDTMMSHASVDSMNMKNSTREDYEFTGKTAGSMFYKANYNGDYKFDLKIDVKGKDVPEKSRTYKNLRSSEVRGLINVTEDKWSELHDEFKGGKHKDGDYVYNWTINQEAEKMGDEKFEVSKKKDSSEKNKTVEK